MFVSSVTEHLLILNEEGIRKEMHSTNICTIIERFHLTLKKEEKYQFRWSFLEWRKTIRNYVPCEMQSQYEIKIACFEISNDDFY